MKRQRIHCRRLTTLPSAGIIPVAFSTSDRGGGAVVSCLLLLKFRGFRNMRYENLGIREFGDSFVRILGDDLMIS